MRLRFTIRDLLWLTLVVAVAIGWWLHYRFADLVDWHIPLVQQVAQVNVLLVFVIAFVAWVVFR